MGEGSTAENMHDSRRRVALLVMIMAGVSLIVEAVAFGLLYQTALHGQRARLEELARSQARLLEAIARAAERREQKDPTNPPADEAALRRVTDAHNHYRGFGETGEFTLGRRDGERIVFLLSHRHYDLQNLRPVPWKSALAEPMRLALAGRSGTLIGLDYRGETVLAAHEPVAGLNWGIVAKIDLAEIRAPFIRAGLLSGMVALVAILVGTAFFFRITNPLIKRLSQTIEELRQTTNQVKVLSGMLPICAACKKIRDPKGSGPSWNPISPATPRPISATASARSARACSTRI